MSPSRESAIRQDEPVQAQPDVDVMLIDQVAARLHISVRTIKRRLRARVFPIPELPRLDKRHRWSSVDVERWIATAATERQSPLRVVRSK